MNRAVSPLPARTQPSLSAARLQCPHHRRAHGDHSTAARIDGVRRVLGHLVAFLVHHVHGQLVGADRLKRAGADMQGDRDNTNSPVGNRLQQRCVEVQPRRRRGDGAGMLAVHGLIALLVLGVRGTRDVRGQRRSAVGIEEFQQIAGELKPVELAAALQNGNDLAVHHERAAGMQGLADAHLAQRGVGTFDPLDEDFGATARILDRAHPRLDNAGVVDDEEILRAQQVDDLREAPVCDRIAFQFQQPTVRARCERRPRDETFRQVVGEI